MHELHNRSTEKFLVEVSQVYFCVVSVLYYNLSYDKNDDRVFYH